MAGFILFAIFALVLAAVAGIVMRDEGAIGTAPAMLAVAMLVLGAMFLHEDAQPAAVEAGHAEYYLDTDNARKWRWLEPCRVAPEPEPVDPVCTCTCATGAGEEE